MPLPSGELLTVAPWAARTMPGLFVLNERATLLGSWQYGFFSLTAVGAYNVGSIHLELDPVSPPPLPRLELDQVCPQSAVRPRSGWPLPC